MSERDLFIAALKLTEPAERAAWLDRECDGDAVLRQRIDVLLQAFEKAGSLLENPVVALGLSTDEPMTEGPGTVIGPYKLLEQIGEGGFGNVFMAEQQQPLRRKVALKVIKPGMDTRQVVARFEAERQALAMMDHINIARVLDAGATNSGRPYFVMELVRGMPITAFCDQNQLPVRQRLESFVAVCQAVQHAHQKGIIHRDIKPSNVLVTLQDGTPTVKVIDFGIAKALGQERLTDKTVFTGFAQMIGTPLYMSPEQAEMSGQDVDTRSDIYALGVLLYELLTGTTPFDKERLKEASYDEIRRIIREEEPVKPSTRISTLGQAATTISANRQSEPRRLSQLFRGELDWILMKALEKDRNRRYDTASSFAADVQRYLNDEPVQACPPSAGYRLRKFARKYRMPMFVAVAFALLLVAGIIVSVWQAVRATDAEREATQKRADAEEAQERARAAEQEMRQQWYAASCNAMQQAWESGQVGHLRALLADTEAYPDRGFEWSYWQRHAHCELQTFIGHRAGVTAVSWSPDGKRLATASGDGTAKVWDVAGGGELFTLKGHRGGVLSVSWSPDGDRLATGSVDGTARIWDAAGREQITLQRQPSAILAVSWSPDGKFLATAGGGDGMAKVWGAADGRELFRLNCHSKRVMSLSWSPDGKFLAEAVADGGSAMVWEVASGRRVRRFDAEAPIWSVCWSPDGKLLATGALSGTAIIWDAASGRKLLTLKGHPRCVWSVSWSPGGKRLATASEDGSVKVWDSTSGRELLAFGHTETIRSVSWSPDGSRLATGSEDGTAKVWEEDVPGGPLTLQSPDVVSVSWSPDGKRLAAGTEDGTAKVWEAITGKELLNVQAPKCLNMLVSWSPDGSRLATSGTIQETNLGITRVLDVSNGRELHEFKSPYGQVWSVCWSPDGKRLVSASKDGKIEVWDVPGNRKLYSLSGCTSPVRSVSWSPNGQLLAAENEKGRVQLWEADDGSELFAFACHPDAITSVSFSPDGKQLATASLDGTAKVWDVSTGRKQVEFKGHANRVVSVCWSPDGKRLATASTDNSVKVWDAVSGRELLIFKERALSVRWSPDGQRLATGSWDGTVKVWETAAVDALQRWARQDRAREEFQARTAFRGLQAHGFIQTWLLVLPFPLTPDESGGEPLDRQQIPNEPMLRPKAGQRAGGKEFVWREYHSPEAVLDFNGVMRQVTVGVAYAACYLESDRARNGLWLQVGSDDQAKVYLNGREIHQSRFNRGLHSVETIGPLVLEQGTNVLLFKVVNVGEDWQGCLRFVDEDGKPVQGLQVRLTPE
jgi:WD40 repeat protein/serine/threonine protein kinase